MSALAPAVHENRGPAWEPLLWFVASLVLYVGLAHVAFYKTDGPDIIRLLDAHLKTGASLAGNWLPGHSSGHPWHVGYLPMLDAFRRALAACGLHPTYVQLGDWFSALGAALAVACTRAGARRLGLSASGGRLAAALLALNPGTLLFATVVEFHGALLGMVGIAFWWTTVQITRPSWWGMVMLGVLGHVAFLIDGQALFLPVWLLAFFLARRWQRAAWQRELVFAAVAGATHAMLFLVLPRLLPECYGFWANLSAGLREEGSIGRPQSLDYTPVIFLQEWLLPLLPVSAMVFVSLSRRSLRREFAAFALGAMPFLYLSVRQLVFEPEFGAYMLPMALPASLLTAQWATQWAQGRLVHLAAASMLLGLWPWLGASRTHLAEQTAYDQVFADHVAAATGKQKPFVLVGSARELAAAYARLQPDELLWVRENASLPREQVTQGHFDGIEAYLRGMHAAGRAVLLTEGALQSLDDPHAAMIAEKANLEVDPNDKFAGPLFAAHLRARFELVPAAPGVLRMVPKP